MDTCSSRWSFLLSRLGFFRMNSFRILMQGNEIQFIKLFKLNVCIYKNKTKTKTGNHKQTSIKRKMLVSLFKCVGWMSSRKNRPQNEELSRSRQAQLDRVLQQNQQGLPAVHQARNRDPMTMQKGSCG